MSDTTACAHCGAHFERYRPQHRYCSGACANKACYRRNAEDRARRVREHYRKTKPPTTCRQCGQSFLSFDGSRGICSDECRIERQRESARRQQHRRRAAESLAYDARDLRRLLDRLGGLCAYCGTAEADHVDHVIPLSRGGRDAIGNLLPACGACNQSKTDKLLVEWRYGRKRPSR